MALFQRNPHTRSDSQSLYSLGQQKTVLIVGLGNIGKEYDGTRHNIGFACVDAFAKAHDFPAWTEKRDLKAAVAAQTLGSTRVILAKPTTFMNRSGEAVQAIAHFYKVPVGDIVVAHDELDIPFGQIRLRTGGSAAGNNGVKSLLEHLDAGFGRIRIGIKAETKMDAADFVLAKFAKAEQGDLPKLEKEVVSILTEYIFAGELPTETRSFL